MQTLLDYHVKLTWTSKIHKKKKTDISFHERCRFHNVHTKEKPALRSVGLFKSLYYDIKSKNSSLVIRPR